MVLFISSAISEIRCTSERDLEKGVSGVSVRELTAIWLTLLRTAVTCLSDQCLVHALTCAFSVWDPKCLVASVMMNALFVAEGTRLITSRSFEC